MSYSLVYHFKQHMEMTKYFCILLWEFEKILWSTLRMWNQHLRSSKGFCQNIFGKFCNKLPWMWETFCLGFTITFVSFGMWDLKVTILPAVSEEDIDSIVYRYYPYKKKRQECVTAVFSSKLMLSIMLIRKWLLKWFSD